MKKGCKNKKRKKNERSSERMNGKKVTPFFFFQVRLSLSLSLSLFLFSKASISFSLHRPEASLAFPVTAHIETAQTGTTESSVNWKGSLVSFFRSIEFCFLRCVQRL